MRRLADVRGVGLVALSGAQLLRSALLALVLLLLLLVRIQVQVVD